MLAEGKRKKGLRKSWREKKCFKVKEELFIKLSMHRIQTQTEKLKRKTMNQRRKTSNCIWNSSSAKMFNNEKTSPIMSGVNNIQNLLNTGLLNLFAIKCEQLCLISFSDPEETVLPPCSSSITRVLIPASLL